MSSLYLGLGTTLLDQGKIERALPSRRPSISESPVIPENGDGEEGLGSRFVISRESNEENLRPTSSNASGPISRKSTLLRGVSFSGTSQRNLHDLSVQDLQRHPNGFAAAASASLIAHLDSLPSQLKLLQQLLSSSQKFDDTNPMNETKIMTALDHLYSVDSILKTLIAEFNSVNGRTRDAPAVESRNPNPKSMREASILFKSLLFTLPNQLSALQHLMSAGHLSTLNAHQISKLLEQSNSQKYLLMKRHCSEVMSLMAVMIKVPLAVAKFKAGGRRLRANAENILARGFN